MSPGDKAILAGRFGLDREIIQAPDKGRADGCANTNIGPGRSRTVEGTVIDVGTSLPYPSAGVRHTPDFRLSWMARIDGCPSCVVNTEAPRWTASTAHGFTAAYTCSDCGHRWSTDWSE